MKQEDKQETNKVIDITRYCHRCGKKLVRVDNDFTYSGVTGNKFHGYECPDFSADNAHTKMNAMSIFETLYYTNQAG